MADNPTIDNGGLTDFVVAADDNGTALVQWMKLQWGGDGVFNTVDQTTSLPVEPLPDIKNISVASAGLTNVTYAAGEQLGTIYTLADAARASGSGGYITAVKLIDANDNMGAVDIMFFDRSVTLATDNAAFAISDADALFIVALVSLPALDIGNNRLLQALNLRIPYICNATSLFAAAITRTANTGITTATTHQLIVSVERA